MAHIQNEMPTHVVLDCVMPLYQQDTGADATVGPVIFQWCHVAGVLALRALKRSSGQWRSALQVLGLYKAFTQHVRAHLLCHMLFFAKWINASRAC